MVTYYAATMKNDGLGNLGVLASKYKDLVYH